VVIERVTLQPEETPGGGLTMAISVPVARASAPPDPGSAGSGERDGIGSILRQAGYAGQLSTARC
jgi:hypothetical protein